MEHSEAVTVKDDELYPIIGVLNSGRGTFKRADLPGSATTYRQLFRVVEGDVIFSKLKAFEGAIAIVPTEHDRHFVSSEFPTFTIAESASKEYISHALRSEFFESQLKKASRGLGARRERVHPRDFLRIGIPLPDIEDQRAVAARLEAFLEAKRLFDLGSALAKALPQAARNAEFADLSACMNATEVRAGEVLQLQRRSATVTPGEQYQEIGLRSFGKGVFHKDPVDGTEIGSKRVFHIEPGDLLISNVFAWEGAVAVASNSERGLIGSHRFMTWTPTTSAVDVRYVFHYLSSELGIQALGVASPGSAGRNRTLSVHNFENLTIPLPDIEEQRAIAARLDAFVEAKRLFDLRSALTKALPQAARNAEFARLMG